MTPFTFLLFFFLGSGFWALLSAADRSNILWITSEDNSPYLGGYGDPQAKTPKLDKFAAGAVRYRNTHESLAAITALETFGRSGIMPMEKVKALIPRMVQGDSNRVIEAIEKIK
ncbi:MAG: hypothetical protein ACKJSK_18660 [Roseibacillus sp.]